MRKFSAKWVPKCLNVVQKLQVCQSSEQILDFFRRDPNNFLQRWVTMDETWLNHYDQETKQQSMELSHSGSPSFIKFRVQKSSGKNLASTYWYQEGSLLIVYIPKGHTMNAEYYTSMLVQFKDILKEKRCGKFKMAVLFWHENAATHCALATQKKLTYLGFYFLDHPPRPPDLDPADYHLFPGPKSN